MDKNEVLQKVAKKKALVGEMENAKINKCCWIGVIAAGVAALLLIVIEALQGHKAVCFGIGAVCFIWAAVFYYCQYFLAKRPVGILLGAIGETLGAAIMILNYVLATVGVI